MDHSRDYGSKMISLVRGCNIRTPITFLCILGMSVHKFGSKKVVKLANISDHCLNIYLIELDICSVVSFFLYNEFK